MCVYTHRQHTHTHIYIYIYIYIYTHTHTHTHTHTYVRTCKPIWNIASKILEHDRLQHDRPATCVIAQQHSSATFVSFNFHSRMKKISPRFTAVINFYFHKISYICLYNDALWPLAIASFVMGSGGCDGAYVAIVTPGFRRSQHQGQEWVETSRVIT